VVFTSSAVSRTLSIAFEGKTDGTDTSRPVSLKLNRILVVVTERGFDVCDGT
jgi:hypothetical protein